MCHNKIIIYILKFFMVNLDQMYDRSNDLPETINLILVNLSQNDNQSFQSGENQYSFAAEADPEQKSESDG